ncbi:Cytosine/adenosine deaminase [Paraburkholderia susongensis]|uniref:Cytosine/adenosine deaminase n=1 Tax=Paraburkholderia susongensis TaxID=1515439 RepID=A0A1X7LY78_9BURK|nr:Cytosine/adenosine deaminase [Paraburkholderia susongensis]
MRDGRIAAIGTNLEAPSGTPVESLRGELVLPGLVDAHTHLDKTLLGMPWHENTAGPALVDKIRYERRMRREWEIDAARQSARQIELSLAQGTTHILTHVDIDTENGLTCLEGVLSARDEWKDLIDIQLAAFPQSGLMSRPGTLELMREAMAMGCDWVGGLDPYAIDRDPKGHLDAIFGLAQTFGRPVDIHLHEPEEMGALTLSLIFERVRALGMNGKVTISHAFCLGSERSHIVGPLLDQLAELDIAVITTGPSGWAAPSVSQLTQAGIRVGSGNDGVRDTWKHYGDADMLSRAMFIGLRNRLCRDDEVALAFDICTLGGARIMRSADYGMSVGCAADLFVVAASGIAETVARQPVRKLVVKRGQVVARDGECIRHAR